MKQIAFLILAGGLACHAADLTGTWNCQVETDMGSGTPTFTLKQTGNKVSGKYEGALGSGDVEGTVTGSKFEYTVKLDQGGLIYKGEVEGSKSKGSVDLAGQAKGTFTCEKK